MKKIILALLLLLLLSNFSFGQENGVTKIFLIRHTKTVDDGSRDPFLSDKGIERAKKWAIILQKEKIQIQTTITKKHHEKNKQEL